MLRPPKVQCFGLVLAGALAACAATAPVLATNPVGIRSNPAHLVAPATEVFIVTVPKYSGLHPASAVVHYIGKSARYHMTLKKAAPHAWGGSVYASVAGTLAVSVYNGAGQVMQTKEFPVAKAKQSWVPRIIIGALFIGIALWYWRRMQSVTNPRGPHQR